MIQIPKDGLPDHIAIIMDGNGRWARQRGLPRRLGHRRGAEALRDAIEGAIEYGIPYLTVFAFSSENWKRSPSENNELMGLLRRYLRNEIHKLNNEGVKLWFIGDHKKLPSDVKALARDAENQTFKNERLFFTVALSYGGRQEIVSATRRLALSSRAGELAPDEIDEKVFAESLMTALLPDPDLLIRTSGEWRLSNFFALAIGFAEMVFLDVL